MTHIIDKWIQLITHYKENGVLVLIYNLLIEFLFIGYFGFLSLLTVETLLPLFITAHISLTKLFIILFLISFFALILGHILEQNFILEKNKKNPFVWIGFFLTFGILFLSIIRFPFSTIPLILLSFVAIIFLFFRIFFQKDETF